MDLISLKERRSSSIFQILAIHQNLDCRLSNGTHNCSRQQAALQSQSAPTRTADMLHSQILCCSLTTIHDSSEEALALQPSFFGCLLGSRIYLKGVYVKDDNAAWAASGQGNIWEDPGKSKGRSNISFSFNLCFIPRFQAGSSHIGIATADKITEANLGGPLRICTLKQFCCRCENAPALLFQLGNKAKQGWMSRWTCEGADRWRRAAQRLRHDAGRRPGMQHADCGSLWHPSQID